MTFQEEHAIETYKSLVNVSMEGLKAALLLNGGAIVALLTYLGHSSLGPALAPHLWMPVVFFVAGLVFSAFAFLASYFTQLSLYNEHFPESKSRIRGHSYFLWAGIACFAISVIFFACGAFTSIDVFSKKTNLVTELKSTQSSLCSTDNMTFVLYRSSVTDGNMRIHVASFDAIDGEAYNKSNCDQAQTLFQAQPGVKTKFWCEKGRFNTKPKGSVHADPFCSYSR